MKNKNTGIMKRRWKLMREIKKLREKLGLTDYHFERWLTETNLEIYLNVLKEKEQGKDIDLTKIKWA